MHRSFGYRVGRAARGASAVSSFAAILVGLALGCGGASRQSPEARPTTPPTAQHTPRDGEPVVTARIETAPETLEEERGDDRREHDQALAAPADPAPPAKPTRHKDEESTPLSGLVSGDMLDGRAGDAHMARESSRHAARAAAPSASSTGEGTIGLGTIGTIGAGKGSGYGSADGVGYGGGGSAVRMRVAKRQALSASGIIGALPSSPYQANTERYAHATDNTFQLTKDSPLSTFSIDVDTASYANVRRFLREGTLPPADAVRIEELVNYFQYDYPQPVDGEPVSVTTEVTAAPWQPDHRLVRIGLRTRAIETQNAPPTNLVFLIDVSGSMADPDKLPLLKRGLAMLAQNLRGQDRVAMVVYAGASGLVLPSTPGSRRADVLAALERLDAGGSTNGAAGIQLAYEVARQNFVKGGVNRVILATDGDFNVGTTSEGELVRMIEQQRKSGVFLTVLGFGRGNLNDSSMEALADHGNGSYAYVDSIAEAHKVLVREAGSTLVTVAKDVKLQIEWNPTRVASYRLIGFENRMLAARDFNDDKKDAGELGAGHNMTALYEIVPLTAASPAGAEVDPLRYQASPVTTPAAGSDELMTLKIRYKRPDSDTSRLMSRAVQDAQPNAEASRDLRWAAAVACFGMLLRNSEHKGKSTLALADSLARGAVGADPEGQRHEFVSLVEQAKVLGLSPAEPRKTAQLAH